uniref:Uncharacterized protein n=1 Tax=Anguilla anguilla TaxID=7936 RepID=A0A0E9VSP8_ANGAN
MLALFAACSNSSNCDLNN